MFRVIAVYTGLLLDHVVHFFLQRLFHVLQIAHCLYAICLVSSPLCLSVGGRAVVGIKPMFAKHLLHPLEVLLDGSNLLALDQRKELTRQFTV